MAAIDIARPRAYTTVDINISCSPTLRIDAFPRSFSDKVSWTKTLVNGFVPSSPPAMRAIHASRPIDTEEKDEEEALFPELPPLHYGRVDVHLRNGVMAASRLSSTLEPDAEKAFFVADLSMVYKQHLRWKKHLPEIEPFYAVKCNPDPYVIRLLAALGTGFDCASNGEIAQVLSVGGIAPSRIIFANPCKAASFVRGAARAGVDLMTFDNADELHKIARVFPAARLVVRILTDDSKSLCRLGLKFGAPLDAVPGLLAQARALNLDVVGVSFHVGSGSLDTFAFADAVRRARVAFEAGAAAGYDFKLLDVGGGFEYGDFEARAAVLRDAVELYFPDRHARGIKVIAEPGRFYVSKAFSLATHIIARRAPLGEQPVATALAEGEAEQPSVMYYINDGVYGAFNCLMFDHQVAQPYVLSMGGSFHVPVGAPTLASSVWGPTCDSIDCVRALVRLPAGLRVGDWLAFDEMGAYTRCAASRFNGFEVSEVVYTLGGGAAAAETRAALARFAGEAR